MLFFYDFALYRIQSEGKIESGSLSNQATLSLPATPSKMPYYAAIRACSVCGHPAHDIRTCPWRPVTPPAPAPVPARSPEEEAAFQRFLAAEQARKDEEARQAAQKTAEEATAKKEEQTRAVGVFRRKLEEWAQVRYAQTDEEIISLGKTFKVAPPCPDIGMVVTYWREERYSGRMTRRNFSFMTDVNWEQVARDGFSSDGWPLHDEADAEATRLAAAEWEKWVSFCIRFVERAAAKA